MQIAYKHTHTHTLSLICTHMHRHTNNNTDLHVCTQTPNHKEITISARQSHSHLHKAVVWLCAELVSGSHTQTLTHTVSPIKTLRQDNLIAKHTHTWQRCLLICSSQTHAHTLSLTQLATWRVPPWPNNLIASHTQLSRGCIQK